MLELFVLLMFGHAIADFGLQSEGMALCKNPRLKEMWEEAYSPKVSSGVLDYLQPRMVTQALVPWYYFMAGHGLIHGFFVWAFTGNVALGIVETVCHFVIDVGKCKQYYGIHVDQALHILCKIVWVASIAMGVA